MIEKVIVHYSGEGTDPTFDLTQKGRAFFCRNCIDGDNKTGASAQIITRDNARNLATHLQRWADTGRWNAEDTSPFVTDSGGGYGGINPDLMDDLTANRGHVSFYRCADAFAANRAERDAALPALDNGATPAHAAGDLFATNDWQIVTLREVYYDGLQYIYGFGDAAALSHSDIAELGWRKLRKVAP